MPGGSPRPAREVPPVSAERSQGDVNAANESRERLQRNAEAGQRSRERGHSTGHEHHKRPNFFQEHLKNIKESPKEDTVGKGAKKALKSAGAILLGAGVAAEGAAAFMAMEGAGAVGITNFVWHSILGHPALSYSTTIGVGLPFLVKGGLALGAPWIITNILEAINKFVGGSTFKLGGGGGGGGSHGGGGGGH